MAVYRRSYTSYTGALAPAWSRSLVLFRYSRRKLFKSRLQTALFVLCFFWPLACLLFVYAANNLSFLEKIGGAGGSIFKIDKLVMRTFIWKIENPAGMARARVRGGARAILLLRR